jgi:hypothetical protein
MAVLMVAPAYTQAATGTNIGNAEELTGSGVGTLPDSHSDDWYVVYPSSTSETVRIEVTNTTAELEPGCEYLDATISDSEGRARGETVPVIDKGSHTFTQAGSDRYFVDVTPSPECWPAVGEALPGEAPHYKVQLLSGTAGPSLKGPSAEATSGGSIGEAGEPLEGHVAYEGSLSGHANDWLTFDVKTPNVLVRVENTTDYGTSCQWINLYATNTFGEVLSNADVPVDFDSAYSFSVEAPGRYFLHVANNEPEQCEPATGGPSTYQIQIDPASGLEQPPNPPRQALQGGATKSSAVGPIAGGTDYYSTVSPSAPDEYYSVDVNGKEPGPELFNVANISPSDTNCQYAEVYIYNSSDTVVAERTLSEDTDTTVEITAAGLYYVLITDNGCEKLEGKPPAETQIYITPAQGVTPGPGFRPVTPPACDQVDFKENEPVSIDRADKPAIAITEFPVPGGTAVEWECNPKTGEVVKNWPVAYVQGQVMKVEARFFVSTATREFLEKELEGAVTITGDTNVVRVAAVKFEAKITATEIAAQLKQHPEYLSTGEVWADEALPKKVASDTIGAHPMEISWEWEVKQKGASASIKQTLGKTVHNLYLTFAAAKMPNSEPIYFTLLDVDTQGIDAVNGEPATAAEALAGVWKGFSTKGSTKGPAVEQRSYNPATGVFSRAGGVLRYYSNLSAPYATAEEASNLSLFPRTCPNGFTARLLENGEGRCGTWAVSLMNALGTEGIPSEPVYVYVSFGQAGGPCYTIEVCSMLVKDWAFSGAGTSGDTTFPYKASAVTDKKGVAGQGVENPIALFWDHEVVKANGVLYDPSYGAGPFTGGKVTTTATVLKEYQKKSIAGFCAPTSGSTAKAALQVQCQKTPASVELVAQNETGGGIQFP